MFRHKGSELEFLLVHPGGPFWLNKNEGAWSIPKGEYNEGEEALAVAQREFFEETGSKITGPFYQLAPVRQKGGKLIQAWAAQGDLNAAEVRSNQFEIEWPPRSGRMQQFPEIDRAGWFAMPEAKKMVNPAQIELLEELATALRAKNLSRNKRH